MSEKQRKSAQEKAQEAVDAAQRKVDSITKRKAAAESQVETLTSDLAAAQATLDYVKQHPALTQETKPEAPDPREANGTTAEPEPVNPADKGETTTLGDF